MIGITHCAWLAFLNSGRVVGFRCGQTFSWHESLWWLAVLFNPMSPFPLLEYLPFQSMLLQCSENVTSYAALLLNSLNCFFLIVWLQERSSLQQKPQWMDLEVQIWRSQNYAGRDGHESRVIELFISITSFGSILRINFFGVPSSLRHYFIDGCPITL